MTALRSTCNEALVELFTALGRSLLQYLDEANPWVDTRHRSARAELDRLAKDQQQSYADIAEVLARRHVLPEPSNFPSDFARLHYLALTFLINDLISNQIGVIAAAEAAVALCGRDSVVRVVQRVRESESGRLADLRRIAESLHENAADSTTPTA